jgi:hypothetical protein
MKRQTAVSEYFSFLPVCSQHADRSALHYRKFLFWHLPVIPHLSTNSSDCGIVELLMLTARVGTSCCGTERSVCGLLYGAMCPQSGYECFVGSC